MITDPKTMARRLRADLAGRGLDVSHSTALEIVAHTHGFADWNTMSANSTSAGASESPTPGTGTQVIGRLSSFRAAQEAARIEALGFTHEAHRPSDHPGFRRLRSGDAVVEVEAREHQMPSADLVIAVDDLDEAHARLAALPHDIVHAGSIAAVDAPPNALRQFTISTPSGHPIAEIREHAPVAHSRHGDPSPPRTTSPPSPPASSSPRPPTRGPASAAPASGRRPSASGPLPASRRAASTTPTARGERSVSPEVSPGPWRSAARPACRSSNSSGRARDLATWSASSTTATAVPRATSGSRRSPPAEEPTSSPSNTAGGTRRTARPGRTISTGRSAWLRMPPPATPRRLPNDFRRIWLGDHHFRRMDPGDPRHPHVHEHEVRSRPEMGQVALTAAASATGARRPPWRPDRSAPSGRRRSLSGVCGPLTVLALARLRPTSSCREASGRTFRITRSGGSGRGRVAEAGFPQALWGCRSPRPGRASYRGAPSPAASER